MDEDLLHRRVEGWRRRAAEARSARERAASEALAGLYEGLLARLRETGRRPRDGR